MRTLIVLLLLLPLATACSSGPIAKAQLDAEVKRLCAIDGGIKVYETVRLPLEKFNKYGQINFYKPMQGENALGAEYVLKWDLHYLKEGNPSLHRSHTRIFRHSDGKLLGESVGYSRGGGDMPGPWQPSSYSCPSKYGQVPLIAEIFVNSNEVNK